MVKQEGSDKRPTVEEGNILVVPYDPRWPSLYASESQHVQQALGDAVVAIAHIGSTSVPNLTAKPIVDILVGLRESRAPSASELAALAALHYEFLGEDGRRPGRWFFRKRGDTAFNLSMVLHDGTLWRDNLMFRDYLRSHPEDAAQYGAHKAMAAAASPDSLLGYTNAKRTFVEDLLRRAATWEATRSS